MPRLLRLLITLQCRCGREFYVWPSEIAAGGGKFCSRQCRAASFIDNFAQRFWDMVDKTAECWTWKASVKPVGYGQVRQSGRTHYAHRVAWQLTNGEIPKGLCVLHRCDNRLCVNPSHLFLGTKADNTSDMLNKDRGRWPGAKKINRKLTADDVRAIREGYKKGVVRLVDLATIYGVSITTISDIVRRATWKHVI